MLIVIEGIDGSGKNTQTERLVARARADGRSAATLAFPRYGCTLFAESIAAYLNGRLGDLGAGTARFAAMLYAGDRFESRAELIELRQANDLLVLDRYVASNLAYQAAKLPDEDRAELIAWIRRLEFEVYRLPVPDLTILLDIPVALATELIRRKARRSYTSRSADVHEADSGYLAACRAVYVGLAAAATCGPWTTVSCVDDHGQLRDAGDIHEMIWRRVRRFGARPNPA